MLQIIDFGLSGIVLLPVVLLNILVRFKFSKGQYVRTIVLFIIFLAGGGLSS